METKTVTSIASEYNKPLVMAYIGDDDVHRGDSQGAIGLAQTVAGMLNGTYLYVDKEVLDSHFQDTRDIHEKLKRSPNFKFQTGILS